MKKNIDIIIGLFIVPMFVLVLAAQGAETGTVSATVMVQNISVSVTDGSIDYGILAAGGSTTTIALGESQTVANNGNVSEGLNIKGQNTASWTLSTSTGSNQYSHYFLDEDEVSWVPLTTDYQTLTPDIPLGESGPVDFKIEVPISSSDYTAQNVDIVIQAIAG